MRRGVTLIVSLLLGLSMLLCVLPYVAGSQVQPSPREDRGNRAKEIGEIEDQNGHDAEEEDVMASTTEMIESPIRNPSGKRRGQMSRLFSKKGEDDKLANTFWSTRYNTFADVKMLHDFFSQTLRILPENINDDPVPVTELVTQSLLTPLHGNTPKETVFAILTNPFRLRNALSSPDFRISMGVLKNFFPGWVKFYMRSWTWVYSRYKKLGNYNQRIISDWLKRKERANFATISSALLKAKEKPDHQARWVVPRKLAYFGRKFLERRISHWLKDAVKSLKKLNIAKEVGANILATGGTGIDLSALPEDLQKAVKGVLEDYFNDIAFDTKKNMIAAIFETPIGSSPEAVLFAAVNEAGPVFLKLLQLVGENAKSPSLKRMMGELKHRVRPMPFTAVQDEVNKAWSCCENGIQKCGQIIRINPEPIGSASVGQVHEASYLTPGGRVEIVAIKVMRPNLHEIVQSEISALEKHFVNRPEFADIWVQVRRSVIEELDYNAEFEELKKGYRLYSNEKYGLAVPFAVLALPSKDATVLVMEKAGGLPIVSLTGNYLREGNGKRFCELALAFNQFVYMWYEEALFKSGSFHGDPHGGNLIFEPSDFQQVDQIWDRHKKSKPEANKAKLWIIDYGNAHQLSQSTRKQLSIFAVGIFFKHIPTILTGLGKADGDADERWGFMEATLRKGLRNVNDLKGEDFAQIILGQASALKITLPQYFLEFMRASELLSKDYLHLKRLEAEIGGHVGCKLKDPQDIQIAAAQSYCVHSPLMRNIFKTAAGIYLERFISQIRGGRD